MKHTGQELWGTLWIPLPIRNETHEVLRKLLQCWDQQGADGGGFGASLRKRPLGSMEFSAQGLHCLMMMKPSPTYLIWKYASVTIVYIKCIQNGSRMVICKYNHKASCKKKEQRHIRRVIAVLHLFIRNEDFNSRLALSRPLVGNMCATLWVFFYWLWILVALFHFNHFCYELNISGTFFLTYEFKESFFSQSSC